MSELTTVGVIGTISNRSHYFMYVIRKCVCVRVWVCLFVRTMECDIIFNQRLLSDIDFIPYWLVCTHRIQTQKLMQKLVKCLDPPHEPKSTATFFYNRPTNEKKYKITHRPKKTNSRQLTNNFNKRTIFTYMQICNNGHWLSSFEFNPIWFSFDTLSFLSTRTPLRYFFVVVVVREWLFFLWFLHFFCRRVVVLVVVFLLLFYIVSRENI